MPNLISEASPTCLFFQIHPKLSQGINSALLHRSITEMQTPLNSMGCIPSLANTEKITADSVHQIKSLKLHDPDILSRGRSQADTLQNKPH